MIGPDAVGAVIDGTVLGREPERGLTRVRMGYGELQVMPRARPGPRCGSSCWPATSSCRRECPAFLSVRNHLRASSRRCEDDGEFGSHLDRYRRR